MPVDKLIGFVDLCRSFGVDVSPAESAAFVRDFGDLAHDDRPLLEEAAVGTLARDLESEAVVRRLFGLYFAGKSAAQPDREGETQKAEESRPVQPRPLRETKPRNSAAPDQTLTPEQVQSVLDALEAETEGGETEEEEVDAALDALEALRGPQNRVRQRETGQQTAGQDRKEMRKLLREMARRREKATFPHTLPPLPGGEGAVEKRCRICSSPTGEGWA